MSDSRTLSTAEYFAGQETLLPQELIWGVTRAAPSPHPRHQRALFRLAQLMGEHVRNGGLGEVFISPFDVVLDRERALVVQPDICFYAYDRVELVTDRAWAPPDLAVEILSPHPRIGELEERLVWFATYGVRECWLVHQLEASVEVLAFFHGETVQRQRFGGSDRIESVVLPDFPHAFADFVSAGG
jgi:Uma2 family endonuclease